MFSRDMNNSAPLVYAWKRDGRFEEYSAANDSKVHKSGFNSLSFVTDTPGVYQRLEEDIISSNPFCFFCYIPTEASSGNRRAPLIPRSGKRPAFVAEFPVQLSRLALSPEPGASAGSFFSTPTEASRL
ncbi:hypothetical protein PAMP_010933 [Pampus punctatissimus]